VTELTTTLAGEQPCVITGAAAMFYAVRHLTTSSLLGSVASNLYRTVHLQARPYPTEFGTAGDAAWGLLHAFDTRSGWTPVTGSTFRTHAKVYKSSDYRVAALHDKLLDLAWSVHDRHAEREDTRTLRIREIHALGVESAQLYADLKRLRHEYSPWVLYPKVWRARQVSHQKRHALRTLIAEGTAAIRERYSEPVVVMSEQPSACVFSDTCLPIASS
jgi:hypothetical protein